MWGDEGVRVNKGSGISENVVSCENCTSHNTPLVTCRLSQDISLLRPTLLPSNTKITTQNSQALHYCNTLETWPSNAPKPGFYSTMFFVYTNSISVYEELM